MDTTNKNDTNISEVKQTNTKKVKDAHHEEYVDGKYVKRMRLCQVFTRMTYANVIIGAVLCLITIIVLFGAGINNPNDLWFGFWVIKGSTSLSAFAMAIIVFDSFWLASYIVQLVSNIILHNKVKLFYVPKILIALSVSVLLMLILGVCCEPHFSVPAINSNDWIYISWMRTLSIDGTNFKTSLTSGAIIILLEMVFIYAACVAYTIYYHVSKIKKIKINQ